MNTITEIAKEKGCCESTVRNIINKLGIQTHKKKNNQGGCPTILITDNDTCRIIAHTKPKTADNYIHPRDPAKKLLIRIVDVHTKARRMGIKGKLVRIGGNVSLCYTKADTALLIGTPKAGDLHIAAGREKLAENRFRGLYHRITPYGGV